MAKKMSLSLINNLRNYTVY